VSLVAISPTLSAFGKPRRTTYVLNNNRWQSSIGDYTKGRGILAAADSSGNLYYGSGDGTVPLASADVFNGGSVDYRSGLHNLYFCAVSHPGLTEDPIVWNDIRPFLEGANTDYTTDQIGQICPDGTIGSLQGVNLNP
jgi:hypothetical protein